MGRKAAVSVSHLVMEKVSGEGNRKFRGFLSNSRVLSTLMHFYRATLCQCQCCICSGLVSVCLSVSMSVTSRSSTKTDKRSITQATPRNSPGNLVFCYQRSC